ncbi:DUF5681 domain-containing protein [Allosphingosinicella deserti]|uniref:DUF5681 domain-containing protein n=1 Tax=Allosphingosinicella deserti TaxID=2116704 RepID=A0A2P7QID4_9SPHN|nr:DUF5681 domain-containing protein [Sphingomonas deserti]PSJ37733.1 hypothetical protein C7I55_22010 [Sphingomonas deserti]
MPDPATASARATTGQFLPGRSGNPAGRPRGARNKASRLREMLDDGEDNAIVRAVVDRALAGEWPALRACFTRLMPPAKDVPVDIDLPDIASAADVAHAGSALIAAVAAGEVTPIEAQHVMKLLARQLTFVQADERRSSAPGADASASKPAAGRTTYRTAPPAPAAPAADPCISPVLATKSDTPRPQAPPGSRHHRQDPLADVGALLSAAEGPVLGRVEGPALRSVAAFATPTRRNPILRDLSASASRLPPHQGACIPPVFQDARRAGARA